MFSKIAVTEELLLRFFFNRKTLTFKMNNGQIIIYYRNFVTDIIMVIIHK